MVRKRRVLVIAEAANPEWVSVPLVGWSMAYALRRVADVHIVTQVRNAEAFTRAGLKSDVDFTAIDTERVASPVYRLAGLLRGGAGKGWTMVTALTSITYPYFEHLVWKKFGPAIRRGEYDVVHRITPLSPTVSSSIAKKCKTAGVPFVLGPLNGGLPWPSQFDEARRKEKEWLSYVRGLYRALPGRSSTLSSATAILAGSKFTASELPDNVADKIVYFPENGIEIDRFQDLSLLEKSERLRLCFIGRLVPYKGLDMALEAAHPLLQSGQAHFDIIGDGPMLPEIREYIARSGVESNVTFHGWVDHRLVHSIAARCSIFVFPSIREFGGGAVLEAMALGLVPLVVDYGGPGELVAEDRGFRISLGTRKEIVERIREVLVTCSNDREKVIELGKSARTWALDNFRWPEKARRMLEVYDWAIGVRSERPIPY